MDGGTNAATGVVDNNGRINSTGTNGVGASMLSLSLGGVVTNGASASIAGVFDGVLMSNATASVVNNGLIAGTSTNGFGTSLSSNPDDIAASISHAVRYEGGRRRVLMDLAVAAPG